jgi:hypothetical protein
MHFFFEAVGQKKHKSFLQKYFKEIVQPFFYWHSFLFILNMFEFVCKARFERLVVSSSSHSFLLFAFKKKFITLHIKLGISYPLILKVSQCICN